MNVLLLHPEDSIPTRTNCPRWDLVLDCGRAPAASYEAWSQQTACPILSLYDFAQEVEDLHLCRDLLRSGFGQLLDRHGIDWWDVLSLRLVPDLLRLIAVDRAVGFINCSCELYATRPFSLANAFRNALHCRLTIMQTGIGKLRAQAQHYLRAVSKLDRRQLAQVVQDKFDRHHALRSRFARRRSTAKNEFILLPSAYINVSRMAIRYAQLLPSKQFLLLLARDNAGVDSTPANVVTQTLSAYFTGPGDAECAISERWDQLRQTLIERDSTFRLANAAGILDVIKRELSWGLSIRDAWLKVFEDEEIISCLCADDTNPYTRIPLLLARNRGIPTVACHHGAFDCVMAIKGVAADSYLSKSKIEYDYLIRECRVDSEKVVLGAPEPATVRDPPASNDSRERDWMVFFTEPYETSNWRDEEVYRDLLPKLFSLAENCGMQLVFKLHPFESVKGHRNKLRRILGNAGGNYQICSGQISEDLWRKTKFALTVESSTALECADRGVPVFLLTWLRDSYTGYVRQYAKFQVGYSLQCSDEIQNIPQILTAHKWHRTRSREPIDAGRLKSLLTEKVSLSIAVNS
jgi:hypothetical protein